MGDLNQEWKELRMKNGNFINHIDGELAKIEKEKRLLDEQKVKLQNPTDAVAFTMQFVAPPPFNCCQDDRDILKALNKAQADRIKSLEDEFLACKEQQKVDLAVKKDLDEKLDKAAADYKALSIEHEEKINNAAKSYARLATERNNLAETVSKMEKTIRDLDERNGTLRERLANTQARLKRSIQEERNLRDNVAYLGTIRQSQAKEIERLRIVANTSNSSCSAYTQQGMQSKIAKQTNEIKRLTEENKQLHKALDIAAKDADANFDRGYHKGMDELWAAIRKAQKERPRALQDIYGQDCMHDCVSNLSAQDFAKKTIEWEEKQAKDIQIGDEVEIFDEFDHDLSDIGIVIAINKDNPCFAVIGPNFEGCFDETDIQSGNVRKTGQHFESIPLNYFA